jgi:hypothetical protein
MPKIVPEVPADAKNRALRAVAHAPVRTGGVARNDKNNINKKHVLVIGFVIC